MRAKWLMLAACLAALTLRLGPLFDNRFHPDEALFSTWALDIARDGNVLLTGLPVDKPPLLLYLSALSFIVFGQSELAARVPNLLASVISVALLYQLGLRTWGSGRLGMSTSGMSTLGIGTLGMSTLGSGPSGEDSASRDHATNLPPYHSTNLLPYHSTNLPPYHSTNLLSDYSIALPPLLLALSPFAIAFAPTAFLDPMMIMFGLASLVAAARGRLGWAGVLLGLSFATKVQGLFFAPLVLLYAAACHRVSGSLRRSGAQGLRLVLGFGLVALSVLIWDRVRGGVPFWVQQSANYGAIQLAGGAELIGRLEGWLAFLPYFFGPIVGLIGLIGLPRLLRTSPRDRWLLLWLAALLAVHGLFNFPIWDRYVLLLVPVAALLLGRALAHLITRLPLHRGAVALVVVAVLILPFSLAAAESQYPIGGDHGANDGIDQVALYLKSLPSGTVVYEHGQAWSLGFYLGKGFAYLSYFDTPAALADDVRVFGGADRYVLLAAHQPASAAIDALGKIGYTLQPAFQTINRFGQSSFTVFKISPR